MHPQQRGAAQGKVGVGEGEARKSDLENQGRRNFATIPKELCTSQKGSVLTLCVWVLKSRLGLHLLFAYI